MNLHFRFNCFKCFDHLNFFRCTGFLVKTRGAILVMAGYLHAEKRIRGINHLHD